MFKWNGRNDLDLGCGVIHYNVCLPACWESATRGAGEITWNLTLSHTSGDKELGPSLRQLTDFTRKPGVFKPRTTKPYWKVGTVQWRWSMGFSLLPTQNFGGRTPKKGGIEVMIKEQPKTPSRLWGSFNTETSSCWWYTAGRELSTWESDFPYIQRPQNKVFSQAFLWSHFAGVRVLFNWLNASNLQKIPTLCLGLINVVPISLVYCFFLCKNHLQ